MNEVIADLKNEVAHQEFRGPTGINHTATSGNALHSEDTAHLAQRIEQVERSVNRILPIVRKILYTVSERHADSVQGGDVPHDAEP